ncbi:hypothetical protein KXD93_00980 [Mucilaginibacter sp. BJC16-A38]|uniref:hypothetical protein n=1 Tax=Mucilaginibacter phenanthrenivorans TaxID=1234842 RepID=UPI0021577A33|nr:hypothetical protein [Mucilaginibacter phenanthrenivorans]MCR8556192.1 hypothetical protein [Mucilaginibacter phenanthrenivorans]
MVTRESLQKEYIKLETIDLLEIAANKVDYTKLASSVAKDELIKRQISEEEINGHEPIFTHKNSSEILANYRADLRPWQKVIFYFIWVPRLRSLFTYNFQQGGYVLKSNQSNYYSVAGVLFCIIAVIITNNSDYSFFAMWPIGLAITYIFDILYNKQRQIDGLQKAVDEGKELKW